MIRPDGHLDPGGESSSEILSHRSVPPGGSYSVGGFQPLGRTSNGRATFREEEEAFQYSDGLGMSLRRLEDRRGILSPILPLCLPGMERTCFGSGRLGMGVRMAVSFVRVRIVTFRASMGTMDAS